MRGQNKRKSAAEESNIWRRSVPWWLIIISLFVCAPISIILLIKKMIDEKGYYIKNGNALRLIGWTLIGFFLVYLLGAVLSGMKADDGSSLIGTTVTMLVLFGGGGAFMIYKGYVYVNRGRKYNRYLSIVTTGGNTSVDSIAAAYPTVYSSAVADLQKMIDAGFFGNAYIDVSRRELILASRRPENSAAVSDVSVPVPTQVAQICPHCGASVSIIPGTGAKCKYCDSAL